MTTLLWPGDVLVQPGLVVGDLHLIEGTMNASMYIRIISGHILLSSRGLFCGKFIFQHDNDPKHTTVKVKK